MLRIGNLTFEVDRQRSELLGYVPQEPPGVASSGRLRWSIEVYSLRQENEQGVSGPCLYANDLALDVRDWRRLDGLVLRDTAEPALAAYLSDDFINQRTADNLVRFSARAGSLFTIDWQCQAHLFIDGDDSGPLPLQLHDQIPFNGVHLWWVKADAPGLATATALVGQHFDLAGLQEPEVAGPYHIVFPPSTLP